MTKKHVQVASSFTSTPMEASLRNSLADSSVAFHLGFTQYSQVSHYMLSSDSAEVDGTLVLIRTEDWLRDLLKSSTTLNPSHEQIREFLNTRTSEFVSQISTLSQRGKPVWFLACPSRGWLAERYKIQSLCQNFTNLLFACVHDVSEVTAVRWPSFLFDSEPEDRAADRLGQIPFTQEAFDKLGRFLGHQLVRTWNSSSGNRRANRDGGSEELAAFLAGLNVKVQLAPATNENRSHFDRLLRSAASFSLAGEQRALSDHDLDSFFNSGICLLVKVCDRLSDYGATGVLAFSPREEDLVVTSMALSCAVFGKQVEWAMICALRRIAAENNFDKLVFEYRPSERNQAMLAFLKSVAHRESDNRYVLPIAALDTRLKRASVNPDVFTVIFEGDPIPKILR